MTEEKLNAQIEDKVPENDLPELWNPNAAAWWGLLFTPIISSYLVSKNWQALGREKEARQGIYWLIGIALILIALPFFGFKGHLGFALCIIWFIGYGIRQYLYVKDTLKGQYKRKPWGKPLLAGVVLLAMIGALNIGVDYFKGGLSTATGLEKPAQRVVNQILQEQLKKGNIPNPNIECVKVEMDEEFAPGNYFATALLNSGEKFRITVQRKGEGILVQIKQKLE
jgi:hypothetical protein